MFSMKSVLGTKRLSFSRDFHSFFKRFLHSKMIRDCGQLPARFYKLVGDYRLMTSIYLDNWYIFINIITNVYHVNCNDRLFDERNYDIGLILNDDTGLIFLILIPFFILYPIYLFIHFSSVFIAFCTEK